MVPRVHSTCTWMQEVVTRRDGSYGWCLGATHNSSGCMEQVDFMKKRGDFGEMG
jgi:hypothetical protein